MTDLSMDARVMLTTFFANGTKNSLKIGGVGAQSVFSDRAEVAINELVNGGYVTASLFNSFGRMQYVGTDKCLGVRLSFEEIEQHGRWSATKPNPDMRVA
ncbi:hypothetical protein G6L34_08695 [Agrobacterium tumefaciens]|uniref:hypothetical protein n=1 Tax=Agrobacterium tumefaciens TaxID=358 RepID=UPI00157469BA|nr:hypothetical protein [Agrobacterium tumefaciens]NTA48171.1 hypothetical protein [Agrobacterium tumefaciens]